MPTYQYECASCKYETEFVQKISDKPIITCPKCKKRKLKRVITTGNFQLKGENWFKTGGY